MIDVYGFGLLLNEALTGVHPFSHRVRASRPRPPWPPSACASSSSPRSIRARERPSPSATSSGARPIPTRRQRPDMAEIRRVLASLVERAWRSRRGGDRPAAPPRPRACPRGPHPRTRPCACPIRCCPGAVRMRRRHDLALSPPFPRAAPKSDRGLGGEHDCGRAPGRADHPDDAWTARTEESLSRRERPRRRPAPRGGTSAGASIKPRSGPVGPRVPSAAPGHDPHHDHDHDHDDHDPGAGISASVRGRLRVRVPAAVATPAPPAAEPAAASRAHAESRPRLPCLRRLPSPPGMRARQAPLYLSPFSASSFPSSDVRGPPAVRPSSPPLRPADPRAPSPLGPRPAPLPLRRRPRFRPVRLPGMPPVLEPDDIYSETRPGRLSPVVKDFPVARLRAQQQEQHRGRDRSEDVQDRRPLRRRPAAPARHAVVGPAARCGS